ncbi:Serpin family [Trema orientale]|uniref:Serpin family n=1 Tax=Trema orientale TaxID=63057 RepID=A0A2P5EUD4_TREOI|nr:Serpin family [Trema orientale]
MELSMQIVKKAPVDQDSKYLEKNLLFSPMTTLLSKVASGLVDQDSKYLEKNLLFSPMTTLLSMVASGLKGKVLRIDTVELSRQIMKQFLLNEEHELEKNFMFSPLSINTLLNIIASGLKVGLTLEHLLSLLGSKSVDDLNAKAIDDHEMLTPIFSSPKAQGPEVCSVSGFWVDRKYKLNSLFQQLIQTLYKAESSTLDFENELVSKATKGLIKTLFQYDSLKDTASILANTLYFKGAWNEPFHTSYTKCENFYALNEDVIEVPYMCSENESYSYATSKGFEILNLPYYGGSGKFSMYIFLPDEKDGLLNLLNQFISDPNLLNLQEIKFEIVEIENLCVPKFKFKFEFGVSNMMERLGLWLNLKVDAEIIEAISNFDDINDAHFSNRLKVFHSCCIDVNEYGTEATSAMAGYEVTNCLYYSSPPINFIAYHLFIFMLREDTTGTLIFLGDVGNPLLND